MARLPSHDPVCHCQSIYQIINILNPLITSAQKKQLFRTVSLLFLGFRIIDAVATLLVELDNHRLNMATAAFRDALKIMILRRKYIWLRFYHVLSTAFY